MLTGLARWLRMAGYDTEIVEPGMQDKLIARQVRAGQRWFLTCDAGMAERLKDYPRLLLLPNSDIDNSVRYLNRTLHLDWLQHAFERCSVCNTPLQQATRQQLEQLHLKLDNEGPIYHCPHCKKLYWEGSHVRRIRQKLQAFQALQ